MPTFNITPGKTMQEMGILIDDTPVVDPSKCEPGYQRISASDAGRDEGGTMHPMFLMDADSGKCMLKRTYDMGWNMIDPVEAAKIIDLVLSKATIYCTLVEPKTGGLVRRLFYGGDVNVPIQQWMTRRIDGKLYSNLTFTLIEV